MPLETLSGAQERFFLQPGLQAVQTHEGWCFIATALAAAIWGAGVSGRNPRHFDPLRRGPGGARSNQAIGRPKERHRQALLVRDHAFDLSELLIVGLPGTCDALRGFWGALYV